LASRIRNYLLKKAEPKLIEIKLKPHDEDEWSYRQSFRLEEENADFFFRDVLNDFMRPDYKKPGWVFENDIGHHEIEATRKKQTERILHSDREYFEQWRTRYFKNIPIGQVVIDRLIRILGNGYNVRLNIQLEFSLNWNRCRINLFRLNLLRSLFDFVETMPVEPEEEGCIPDVTGLIIERTRDILDHMKALDEEKKSGHDDLHLIMYDPKENSEEGGKDSSG